MALLLKRLLASAILSLTILILIVPPQNSYSASTSVFGTNFDAGAPAQFSGITTTEPIQGYAGVGSFSGSFLRNQDATAPIQAKTILTLNNLACHTSVDIGFELAIIDSWDGTGSSNGPDAFEVHVDGSQVFKEIFAIASGSQTYENPPTTIQITPNAHRGFNGNFMDGAYDMNNDNRFQGIAHTSSTLTVEWFASGPGWQGSSGAQPQDESWAIDNVNVILNGIDDPSCINNAIGGELLLIEITPLLVAGAQSISWLIPVTLSILGIGLFVVSRKSKN